MKKDVQGLSPNEKVKKNLVNIFGTDLTNDIAEVFMANALKYLALNNNSSIEEIKMKLKNFYYKAGKELFGPIFVDFVYNVLKKYDLGDQIFFLERDGIVLYNIAKELLKKYPDKFSIKENQIDKLILSRRFLGLADEIAGFSEKSVSEKEEITKKAKQYLNQKNVGPKSLLVDTGCYGTIIWTLFTTVYGEKKEQLPGFAFLVSKNLNITGFANGITQLSVDDLALLLDAVECQIPKLYESPGNEDLSFHNGKAVFSPKYLNYEYDIGSLLLEGMEEGIMECLDPIVQGSMNSGEEFTSSKSKVPSLIIPSTTDIRSERDDFLRKREESGFGKINDHVNGFN